MSGDWGGLTIPQAAREGGQGKRRRPFEQAHGSPCGGRLCREVELWNLGGLGLGRFLGCLCARIHALALLATEYMACCSHDDGGGRRWLPFSI